MFVTVNGARIFFDSAGPELALADDKMVQRPTLLVLHGGPGFDHSTMRPYFDRFADSHHVVYLDHRGNGRSSGERATWTLAQWGDDVKAFCDALGIVKPIVYGNSFGGMVAMSYATRYPAHPSKLILSSTAARMQMAETLRVFEAKGGTEARNAAEKFWRDFDEASLADYMRLCMPLYNPPGSKEGGAAIQRRAIMRTETMRHFSLGEIKTMNALPDLARIACPVLVLGGREDPITPVLCASEIFAALPKDAARIEIFDGAGHGVHRDRPDEAEQVLRSFLAA
jgi:pimeloyl-ACP methyl ester carboxylesterase